MATGMSCIFTTARPTSVQPAQRPQGACITRRCGHLGLTASTFSQGRTADWWTICISTTARPTSGARWLQPARHPASRGAHSGMGTWGRRFLRLWWAKRWLQERAPFLWPEVHNVSCNAQDNDFHDNDQNVEDDDHWDHHLQDNDCWDSKESDFNYWCHELVAAFLPDLVHGQAFVLVGGTLCAQGVLQETIAWPCANSIFVHLMPHGPSFISPYLVVSFRLCLRHAKTTWNPAWILWGIAEKNVAGGFACIGLPQNILRWTLKLGSVTRSFIWRMDAQK